MSIVNYDNKALAENEINATNLAVYAKAYVSSKTFADAEGVTANAGQGSAINTVNYTNIAEYKQNASVSINNIKVLADTSKALIVTEAFMGKASKDAKNQGAVAIGTVNADTKALFSVVSTEVLNTEKITLKADATQKDIVVAKANNNSAKGIAYAVGYITYNVNALISGNGRIVATGDINVKADSKHDIKVYSYAGESEVTYSSDYAAIDVSDAVAINVETVKAAIEGAVVDEAANMNVVATSNNTSDVDADLILKVGSDYADTTGATVALAVLDTKTEAYVAGNITLSGKANIYSNAVNADTSAAIEAKLGASALEYYIWIKNHYSSLAEDDEEDTFETITSKDSDGKTIFDRIAENSNATGIGNKINTILNKYRNSEDTQSSAADKDADGDLPLSVNILRTQDATTAGSGITSLILGTLLTKINELIDSDFIDKLSFDGFSTLNGKLYAAAALATNVLNHKSYATVYGRLTASEISIKADSNNSFSTVADGKMSYDDDDKMGGVREEQNARKGEGSVDSKVGISTAVALTLDKNESIAQAGSYSEVTTTSGNVDILANLEENTDSLTRIVSYAVAGTIGMDSKDLYGATANKIPYDIREGGIGNALSQIAIYTKTQSLIGENAKVNSAADINVIATDKTRYSAQAGDDTRADRKLSSALGDWAGSIAEHYPYGSDGSFALIYAHADIYAKVCDDAVINCEDLTVKANKEAVTTVNTNPTIIDVFNVNTSDPAIIGVDKQADGKGYDVSYSVTNTYELGDVTNYGSIFSYYATAIGGELQNSSLGAAIDVNADVEIDFSKGFKNWIKVNGVELTIDLSKATMTRPSGIVQICLDNEVLAEIGAATVNTTGKVDIDAVETVNTEAIAGSERTPDSYYHAGTNIAYIENSDVVKATVKAGSNVTATGNFDLDATSNQVNVSVAEIHSTGIYSDYIMPRGYKSWKGYLGGLYETGNTFGGSFNMIVTKAKTIAEIGDGTDAVKANIKANDVDINAVNNQFSVMINSEGGSKYSGKALTIGVVNNQSATTARIGKYAIVEALNGNVNVKATANDKMVSAVSKSMQICEVSDVLDKVSNCKYVITLRVLYGQNKAEVEIGDYATVTGSADINVNALNNTVLRMLASGIALDCTVLRVQVNLFEREVYATVGQYAKLTAGANISVSAVANEDTQLYATAAGLSATESSMNGVFSATVTRNTVTTTIKENAKLEAGKNLAVLSDLVTKENMAMGSVSVGKSVTGIIIGVALFGNHVHTNVLTDAYLKAVEKFNVNAQSQEHIAHFGVSAAGGKSAKGGVAITIVQKNEVVTTFSGKAEGASVEITASDDTHEILAGGAANLAFDGAKGATILVLVYSKDVEVRADNAQEIKATNGSVTIKAKSTDDMWMLSATVGVSAKGTTISGDSNVLVFGSTVKAIAGGKITATQDINVYANNEITLIDIGAILGASLTGTAFNLLVVFTYFTGVTHAAVSDNAILNAGRNINIIATSKENNSPDAASIAGGSNGVGVAADILISSIETRAYTGTNVTLTAGNNVSIQAVDNYSLLAIVACIAGGATAGIGVSVVVAVLKNNVQAMIGASNNVTATAGTVEVSAKSNRDIDTYVASIALAGTAAVAPAVSVVLAGSKLSKDASEGVAATKVDFSDTASKTFGNNPLVQNEKSSLLNNGHCDELDSDGQSVEDLEPSGGYDSYGQSSGKSFGGGVEGDENASENYAENENPTDGMEGDDIASKQLDKTKTKTARKDAASAIIGASSHVTAGKDIKVLTNDVLKADVIAGTIAVGGTAGISIGVGVAILSSNINSEVQEGAVLSAGGDVIVEAITGSESRNISDIDSKFAGDSEATKSRNKMAEKMAEVELIPSTPGKSTIRVISLSVAGSGTAAAGLACGVLIVYSDVQAVMNGNIAQANKVTVHGDMEFGEVVAAVLGVAVSGGVAIGGSAGYVNFAGTMNVGIGANANIGTASAVKNVKVYSEAETKALVAAASIAGGVAGIAAGVALVYNRTSASTYIGRGAYVNAIGNAVSVTADIDATAKAFIIAMSFGSCSFGATVAIVTNNAQAYTYIGTVPGTNGSGNVGTIIAKSIEVKNNVHGTSTVLGFGLSAGVVSANGIVALNFNNVVSKAGINGMNVNNGEDVKTDSVKVDSKINGDANVKIASVSAGAVALGACVGIAKVGALSYAIVSVDGNMNIKDLVIGESACSSEASIEEVSGKAGGVAAALNFGLAINKSHYKSELTGTENGVLNADTVTMVMNGNAVALVAIASASIGGTASVNCSVPIALTQGIQEAIVGGTAVMNIGTLTASSTQNKTFGGKTITLDIGDSGLVSGGNYSVNFNTMAQTVLVSCQAGMVTVGVSATVVIANATCRTKVGGKHLTINGGLTVTADADTAAKTTVFDLAVSAVGIGTVAAYTYAKGTVEAILEVIDGGEVNLNGNALVKVTYNANSECDLTPGAGGGLITAHVNAAIAKVKSNAYAKIQGSGTLNANGNEVRVVTNGKVTAKSMVRAQVISASAAAIGASFVMSVLAADQQSIVDGVNIKAGKLAVLSFYNVNESSESTNPYAPSACNNYGAFSIVGAPLVEISGISIKANIGLSFSSSTVKAVMMGASPTVTGDIYINTFANSYANTTIEAPNASMGAVNASVAYVRAYAKGTYESGIYNTNANAFVKANNLYIGTGYRTYAYSVTGPLGGGASISAVSVTANIARAYTQSYAYAYLISNGGAEIGNINVKAKGESNAKADVFSYTVKISLVDAAANHLYSYNEAHQGAYTDFGGNVNCTGKINVISELNGSAYAKVGNNEGVSLSLISGAVNFAYAITRSTNEAYLGGNNNGIIKAYRAKINAITVSDATAIAQKPISLSIAEGCGQIAESDCGDVVYAHVGNGNPFTLETEDTVEVLAKATTNSYTESASGVSVSAISASGGSVVGYIGAYRAQTVKAFVASNAIVKAKKDITILAENKGTVKALMTSGFKVSIVGISANDTKTVSNYLTEAYVGDNAYVESILGNLTIKAYSYADANAVVSGNGCGVLVSADIKGSINVLTQTTNAYVGTGSTVQAYKNINITSVADANVYTRTNANSGGIFSGGSLKSSTTVARTSRINIADRAFINARYGNLNVIIEIGRNDNIVTQADGSSAGLVSIGGANATTSLVNDGQINIGDANLYADFGTLNVLATVAENRAISIGDFSGGGLAGSPLSYTYDNSARLNAAVNLNSAYLRGDNVNVASQLKELFLYADSYAKLIAAGGASIAKSRINLDIDTTLNITNGSELNAYTQLNVYTNANPTSSGANIQTIATSKMYGAGGWVEARAFVEGSIVSNATIADSTLRGYRISMYTNGFAGTITANYDITRVSLLTFRGKSGGDNTSKSSGFNVNNGTVIELGGAALGSKIGVDEYGNVYSAGLRQPVSSTVETVGGVKIVKLSGKAVPRDAGTLSASTVDCSKATIRYYLGGTLEVANYLDGELHLCAVDMTSANQVPTIYVKAGSASAADRDGYLTNIAITSYNGGDVTFDNVIMNEKGSMSINWNGEAGNIIASTIAIDSYNFTPVWTSKLSINNANNIGKSTNVYRDADGNYDDTLADNAKKENNTYFQIFLAQYNGTNPILEINAVGDVYVEPVLVDIIRTDSLSAVSTDTVNGKIVLGDITAGYVMDIHYVQAARLKYLPTAGGVAICGATSSLVYVDGSAKLSTTIDHASLARYEVEDKNGVKTYELPDGTKFILDVDGKLVSLNGYEQIERKENSIVLSTEVVDDETYYVTFNYTTGLLHIDAGYESTYTLHIDNAQYNALTNGKKIALVNVLTAETGSKWADTELTGKLDKADEDDQAEIAQLLSYEVVSNALEKGGFGNYYVDGELNDKIEIYKLCDGSEKKIYTIIYNGLECLGIFAKGSFLKAKDDYEYTVKKFGDGFTKILVNKSGTAYENGYTETYFEYSYLDLYDDDGNVLKANDGSGNNGDVQKGWGVAVVDYVYSGEYTDYQKTEPVDPTAVSSLRYMFAQEYYYFDGRSVSVDTDAGTASFTFNTNNGEETYYSGTITVETTEDITITEEVTKNYYYNDGNRNIYISLPNGIEDTTEDKVVKAKFKEISISDIVVTLFKDATDPEDILYYYESGEGTNKVKTYVVCPENVEFDADNKAEEVTVNTILVDLCKEVSKHYYYTDANENKIYLTALPKNATKNVDGTYSATIVTATTETKVTIEHDSEGYYYVTKNDLEQDVKNYLEFSEDWQSMTRVARIDVEFNVLANPNGNYVVSETQQVTPDGTVITYSKDEGIWYYEHLNGNVYAKNSSTVYAGVEFVNGEAQAVISNRSTKLEKVLENVAKDLNGNHYLKLGEGAYTILTAEKNGETTYYKYGSTIVYETNANGYRLYENGVAKYKCEDGVLSLVTPITAATTAFAQLDGRTTSQNNTYDVKKIESTKGDIWFWFEIGNFTFDDANDENGKEQNIVSNHDIYEYVICEEDNGTVKQMTNLDKAGHGDIDGVEYSVANGGVLKSRNNLRSDVSYLNGDTQTRLTGDLPYERDIIVTAGSHVEVIIVGGSVTGHKITLEPGSSYKITVEKLSGNGGNVTFEDIIIDGTTAETLTYFEISCDGDITVNSFIVSNNGSVDIVSYGGGFYVSNNNSTTTPAIEVGNGSKLIVDVDGDIKIDSMSIHNVKGNTVKLYSANGTATIPVLDITLGNEAETGNDVVVDAMGDISIDTLTMSNTSAASKNLKNALSLKTHTTSGNVYGNLISKNWTISNSVIDGMIAGNIVLDNDVDRKPVVITDGSVVTLVSSDGGLFGIATGNTNEKTRTFEVDNSTLKIVADKNVTLPILNVKSGNVTLDSTSGSTLFDQINVSGISNITLAANNDIDLLNEEDASGATQHAAITFAADTVDTTDPDNVIASTLTLTAGGDIGNTARWIYIDVPEEVTPTIKLVNSFYIDAQQQIPWNIYKYFVTNGVGVDSINLSFNSKTCLDYLGYSDVQYFVSLFDLDTNEKLANWIINHVGNNSTIADREYYSYIQLDNLYAYLNNNEAIEAEDVDTLVALKTILGSSKVANLIKTAYEQAFEDYLVAHELDDPTGANFDKVAEYKKAFEAALKSDELDADAQKALVLYLLNENDEYIADAANVGKYLYGMANRAEFISELFFEGANVNAEYTEMLYKALESAYATSEEVEKEQVKANADLDKAQKAYETAYANQLSALESVYDAVYNATKLKDSKADQKYVEEAISKIAKDLNNYFNKTLADPDYDPTAYTKDITNILEQLNKKSALSNSNIAGSVDNIFNLAKSYLNKVSEADASYITLEQARARVQLLNQRYREINDSVTDDEEVIEQTAKSISDILKAGGTYDQAIEELNKANAALEKFEKNYFLKIYTSDKKETRATATKLLARITEAQTAITTLLDEVCRLMNINAVYDGRDFTLRIGEMYGDAHLYNTGDITIDMSNDYAEDELRQSVLDRAQTGEVEIRYDDQNRRKSDITITNIRSEYGDVDIANNSGSILTAVLDDENVDYRDQEWIYKNDGVDYENAYINGSWMVGLGNNVDSTFARNYFTNLYEFGQKSIKNFDKVHIVACNLYLKAADSIGTKDNVLTVETRGIHYNRIENATGSMDPYGYGEFTRSEEMDMYFTETAADLAIRKAFHDKYLANIYEDIEGYELIGTAAQKALFKKAENVTVDKLYTYGAIEYKSTLLTLKNENGDVIGYGIPVAAHYDWIRTYDNEEAMEVCAIAVDGDLYMAEETGSVNLVTVTAGNDLVYTVPGSIYDGRDVIAQIEQYPNIYAGHDATITVNATDGKGVTGTKENPLLVQVGTYNSDKVLEGVLTLTNNDSIYLEVLESLTLNAYCPTSHYEITTLSNYGSVYLKDMNPDTTVLTGFIYAKGGVSIDTVGNIGTAATPFEITDKTLYYGMVDGTVSTAMVGLVSFSGKNVYLHILEDENDPEIKGNAVLDRSYAEGNLVLTADGDISDGNKNGLREKLDELIERQIAYNYLKNELEKYLALKASIDNNAARDAMNEAEAVMLDAETAKTTAQTDLDNAILAETAKRDALAQFKLDMEDLKQKETLTETEMNDAIQTLIAKEKELEDAVKATAAARKVATEKTTAYNKAKADYESAKANFESIPNYEDKLAEAYTAKGNAETVLNDAITAETNAKNAYDAKKFIVDGLKSDPSTDEETLKAAEAALADLEKAWTAATAAKVKAQADYDACVADYTEAEQALTKLTEARLTAIVLEAEVERAALKLDAYKMMLDAQMALDDAIERDEAEADDLSYNNKQAERYLYTVTEDYLDAVDSGAIGSVLAKCKKAIESAQFIKDQITMLESLLTEDNEALSAVLGLTDTSTEDDVLNAVVAQQNWILGIVDLCEKDYHNSSIQEEAISLYYQDIVEWNALISDMEELIAANKALEEATTAKNTADQNYLKVALKLADNSTYLGYYFNSEFNKLLKFYTGNSSYMNAARELILKNQAYADATTEKNDAQNAYDTLAARLNKMETAITQYEELLRMTEADYNITQTDDAIATKNSELAALKSTKSTCDSVVAAKEAALTEAVNRLKDLVKDGGLYKQAELLTLVTNPDPTQIRIDLIDRSLLPLDTRAEVDAALESIYTAQSNLAKTYAAQQDIDAQIAEKNDEINTLKQYKADQENIFSTIATDNSWTGANNAESIINAHDLIDDYRGNNGISLEDSALAYLRAVDNADDVTLDATLNVTGNATIRTGGNFGDEDKAVTTDIKGTIDIISCNEINIESEESLRIVRAESSEIVTLVTMGDITTTGRSPAIDTDNLAVVAITGSEEASDGTHDIKATVDVKALNGFGDTINITNLHNGVELGMIYANEDLILNLNGDVTGLSGGFVVAESITLNTNGNIGETDEDTADEFEAGIKEIPGTVDALTGALNINTKKLNMSGKTVNIHSIASQLDIEKLNATTLYLTAEGNLGTTGEGVRANEVNINANGNIGTPANAFVIHNASKLNIHTIYGYMNYINIPDPNPEYRKPVYRLHVRWDEDGDLGGAVGYFPRNAWLTVSELSLNRDIEEYDLLKKAVASEYFLAGMNVETNFLDPVTMIVRLPLDTKLEEGDTVYALTYNKHQIYVMEGVVRDGNAMFKTPGLNTFTDLSFVVISEEGLEGLDILNELGITEEDIIHSKWGKYVLKYIDENIPEREIEEIEPEVKKEEEPTEPEPAVVVETPDYTAYYVGAGILLLAIVLYLYYRKKRKDNEAKK